MVSVATRRVEGSVEGSVGGETASPSLCTPPPSPTLIPPSFLSLSPLLSRYPSPFPLPPFPPSSFSPSSFPSCSFPSFSLFLFSPSPPPFPTVQTSLRSPSLSSFIPIPLPLTSAPTSLLLPHHRHMCH